MFALYRKFGKRVMYSFVFAENSRKYSKSKIDYPLSATAGSLQSTPTSTMRKVADSPLKWFTESRLNYLLSKGPRQKQFYDSARSTILAVIDFSYKRYAKSPALWIIYTGSTFFNVTIFAHTRQKNRPCQWNFISFNEKLLPVSLDTFIFSLHAYTVQYIRSIV
jgi:hypothetical protein